MLRFSPDFENLLPREPEGFEPCRGELGPTLTAEESEREVRALRAAPPLGLAPLSVSARRDRARLVVARASGPAVALSLGPTLEVVHVTRESVAAQLTSKREWDSFYGDVVNAILPKEAFVAYAGEEDWRDSASYNDVAVRIYAFDERPARVAEEIERHGREVVRRAACAQTEGTWHRAAFWVGRDERAGWRRVLLRAPLFYADYGGVANVELATRGLGDGAIVTACLYSGDPPNKTCDALSTP